MPPWAWVRVSPSWRKFDNSQVLIETEEGQLLALPSPLEALPQFLSQLPPNPKFLCIVAKTFICSLSFHNTTTEELSHPYTELRIKINKNFSLVVKTQMNREPAPLNLAASPQLPRSLTGILLGDTSGESFEVVALVVRELDG
jgi:hypothetical protein